MKWATEIGNLLLFRDEVSSTVNRVFGNGTTEPQIIADLLCHLSRTINKFSYPKSYSVKAGGVFVHAQPFVACDDFPDETTKSVEIGDLLLLQTEVKGTEVKKTRALLLQAKKATSLPIRDNINQYHLYHYWPEFKYVCSGKLNNKKRKITGLDLHDAAKYLLINQGNPNLPLCCYPYFIRSHQGFTACPSGTPLLPKKLPKKLPLPLSHYRCFVCELVEFILGDAGKEFVLLDDTGKKVAYPSSQDNSNGDDGINDWDRVINDLINITGKQLSRYVARSNKNDGRLPRGKWNPVKVGAWDDEYGVLGFNLGKEKFATGANDNEPPKNLKQEGQDNNGGFGIIEFVVRDNSNDNDKVNI